MGLGGGWEDVLRQERWGKEENITIKGEREASF